MKKIFIFLIPVFIIPIFIFCEDLSFTYSNIDQTSFNQLLAFYELYPETEEGQKALIKFCDLISTSSNEKISTKDIKNIDVADLTSLINLNPIKNKNISKETFTLIKKLSKKLKQKKLKGHYIWEENKINNLNPNDIDIARALLLTKFKDNKTMIRNYEACLDLMALQILAKINKKDSNEKKIDAINSFLFFDIGFKFPPHRLYKKNIDTYTFLSSVMDTRKGICLGISVLYLCLAQRIGLPLTIITPPGHIFLRYDENKKNQFINIETTDRGIDLSNEVYLNIETKELQKRNYKETIGLVLINQASMYWSENEYDKAVNLYEKALIYLPDDLSLKEFLSYNYLFVNKIKQAQKILKEIKNKEDIYSTTSNSIIEDYLNKKVDIDSIKVIFSSVESSKEALLKKQNDLKQVIQKNPKFRAAICQLSILYLNLGLINKALYYLEKHNEIDDKNPLIHYYLSEIYFERLDYKKAWNHFTLSKELLKKQKYYPKELKKLYKKLKTQSPEI